MEKPIKQTEGQPKERPQKRRRFDHAGCPSFPFCSDAPLGCLARTKAKDIDWYGHKD